MADSRAEEPDRGGTELIRASVAALVIFAISLLMVVLALDFGREARRLPLVVGVPLLVLAAMNLAKEVGEVLRRRRGESAEKQSADPSDSGFVLDADELMRRTVQENASGEVIKGLPLTAGLAMLALLVVLYVSLGQVASTPVFVVLAMRFFNRRPWAQVAITALIMTAFMYYMTAVLQLPSYEGLLPEYWPWLGEVLR